MAFVEEEFFIDDDLDILDIVEFGFPRKVYNRTNHFEDLDNLTFFKRFRLTKNTVFHLLELIECSQSCRCVFDNNDNNLYVLPFLFVITCIFRNNSVTPIDQLLAVLRFYVSAGHLSTVSDFIGTDVSTASRIVAKVTRAIAKLYPQFVKMPDPNDFIEAQTDFYRVVSFPRVIGCVDGTNIRIQSPAVAVCGEDAEIFRNRKSYFSINTQLTCSADLKFINVVARWPGSTHDSTIFNNCALKAQFERGDYPNSYLLGDCGYPMRNYFLTPLLNPNGRAQQLYNNSLIRTRISIERAIGVWKRRFPIMAYGTRLKLDTILTIIVATTVLHNLAIDMNEPEPPLPEEVNINELHYLIEMGQIPEVPQNNNAHQHVAQLINYFSNL
ncbi:hypothetical protein RI129_002912 [Pyrocoelia pectoralis]|uniref:DDE Tnp4 domain-containing protein n=1 Tax=Pyrocoelia pectoralis TaxID=417401 RepID=A0AAN7ZI94_9COLE